MKNILFPLDFYDGSRQALKELFSFLRDKGANFKVFLLDTYMVPYSASDEVINAHDELRRRSLEKLQEALRTAQELSTNGKISFEILSQIGTPVNVISRVIKERAIDCVIFGAKNARNGSPKKDEIMNVLNRLHCPMTVLSS